MMNEIEQIEENIIQIFRRYNDREDIESELQSIGFEIFFGTGDEKIYFTPERKHDILLYINWVDACFWIYKRSLDLKDI